MAYRYLTKEDIEGIIDARLEAAQERFLETLETFTREVEERAAAGKAKPRTKKPEPQPEQPAELDDEGTLTDLLGTAE